MPTMKKTKNVKAIRLTCYWHKAGFTLNGVKIPKREMPKARLSQREANLLAILQTHANTVETAKPMRYILDKYVKTFDDYLDSALCSAALLTLKENWFASLISGKTAIVNKHTEETKTTKKPKYYLSEMVNFGLLKIDLNRWVVLKDVHVADVQTRLKIEENDLGFAKKSQRSFDLHSQAEDRRKTFAENE